MYRPVSAVFRWIACLSWFFDGIVMGVRIPDCASWPLGGPAGVVTGDPADLGGP